MQLVGIALPYSTSGAASPPSDGAMFLVSRSRVRAAAFGQDSAGAERIPQCLPWLRSAATRPSPPSRRRRSSPMDSASAPRRETLRLNLAGVGTLRPVAAATPSDVGAWFADRVPVVLPAEAEPILDTWANACAGCFGHSDGDGPGRSPAEQRGLVTFLRERMTTGEPFTFNALHREDRGGRQYPYLVPGYDGPLTISSRKFDAGRPRHLLSAVKREVRSLLRPPGGWVMLELDFRACHPVIAFALSGDEQLGIDLVRDVHQVAGERFFAELPPAERRAAGKKLNNAMLFGLTSHGVRDLAREVLGREPRDRTGTAAWAAWWSCYPRLHALRERFESEVRRAQNAGFAIEIESPSRCISRFSRSEVAGRVEKSRSAPGQDRVWRTLWSACFRAVEADVLNRTLAHLHEHGGGCRPVLPLYDGLLAAAPEDAVEVAQAALHAAATRAATEVGLVALEPIVKRRAPTPARAPAPPRPPAPPTMSGSPR